MKKISIALCTKNGARFLTEQLASFRRQTRLPDELVICDDCSNDGTIEIIKRFAETSAFPVLFNRNENNLGSTVNFERAISLCAGDIEENLIFYRQHAAQPLGGNWKYRRFENLKFQTHAAEFENAPADQEVVIPINPNSWDM